MSFPQTITAGFKNCVSCSRQPSRSKYWFWILFSVVGHIVLALPLLPLVQQHRFGSTVVGGGIR